MLPSFVTLLTLSLAAALPFQAAPLQKRDDNDDDGSLSCVVFQFASPFNDATFRGQAYLAANLTTLALNNETSRTEPTDNTTIRLGVGSDDGIISCKEQDDCPQSQRFAFEICETSDLSNRQYGGNSPELVYGHIIYRMDDEVKCVTAQISSDDDGNDALERRDDNDDDNNDNETGSDSDSRDGENDDGSEGDDGDNNSNGSQTSKFNGTQLGLSDCKYNLDESVAAGQYFRMLLIYDSPRVYLVTSNNVTLGPDPALAKNDVPVELYSYRGDTAGPRPFTWFSFTPAS